jgi:hypothetical protein
MSIAPLHGRSAPLLFVKKPEIKWPRYRPAEVRAAPLSTRARKLRRRRIGAIATGVLLTMIAVATIVWIVWTLRS